jgi:hypothetical protein
MGVGASQVRSEAGREVAAAMQEGRGLWISYKGGSHERKPRLVKPLRWQPHTAKSLFVGLCGYTDGEKEFYVHNILVHTQHTTHNTTHNTQLTVLTDSLRASCAGNAPRALDTRRRARTRR